MGGPVVAVAVVVAVAAGGVLVGPALAALTVLVPAGAAVGTGGWAALVLGHPAGRRRVALVTVGSGGVSVGIAATVGPVAVLPAVLVLGAAAVVLAVVDAEHHRLPDRVLLPATVLSILLLAAAAITVGRPLRLLAAGAGAAGVFAAFLLLALAGPAGLGFGDVKLGALLGLHLGWLGWEAVVIGIAAGFTLGALTAIVLVVAGRATMRTPVAFGPALLAGTLLTVTLGAG